MKKKRFLSGLVVAMALLLCGGLAACGGSNGGGADSSGSHSSSSESSESSEKHNHAYVTQVTAPTCTAWGYTMYTCECGDSYVGDYVEALGHSYDDGRVILAPRAKKRG